MLNKILGLLLVAVCSCGGSNNEPAMTQTGEWQGLVDHEWTIPAGEEEYYCVRKTVDKDMYLSSFRAISPLGTHHTVLTAGTPNGPDGVTVCNGLTNESMMIYGSGVDTNPIQLPDGVAVKIEAGQQLLLNLHLFNTNDAEALSGTSGIEIKEVPEAEVGDLAEGILAGALNLTIPAEQVSTSVGHCTMNGDVTLLSVAPHMHQMGTHMKVVIEDPNGDIVIHDNAYDFFEQKIFTLDTPLELAQGTKVRVECTYNNNTQNDVGFGDSSGEEMCFAGLLRYPALGGDFNTIVCSDELL